MQLITTTAQYLDGRAAEHCQDSCHKQHLIPRDSVCIGEDSVDNLVRRPTEGIRNGHVSKTVLLLRRVASDPDGIPADLSVDHFSSPSLCCSSMLCSRL